MEKDKPEIPNKLLEFQLRHYLPERLADQLIKSLAQRRIARRTEVDPDDELLLTTKEIAKALKWPESTVRKRSKEMQALDVAFLKLFTRGGQRRRILCAWKSDLKWYSKRRGT